MKIIGLMSGTSVDGIDVACVEIDGCPGAYEWGLAWFECVPWPSNLRAAILDACRSETSVQVITALNFGIGEAFAAAAVYAMEAVGWGPGEVNAIASHGQTVWHQPTPFPVGGIPMVGTLQLGEPAVIAARTGCMVISDFRVADMAVGGQGAPLVPFVDHAFFSSSTETRAVQNLGGIGNVTFLPAGGDISQILAFDTGPANMLMDGLVRRLTDGMESYDEGGIRASRGRVCRALLEACLAHPFYRLAPPRSTGREMFGAAAVESFVEAGRGYGLSADDLLATATALSAQSIGLAYRDYLTPLSPISTVILGGGGVRNDTLFKMIREAVAPVNVTTSAAFGLPGDAKEAVAFAVLGYESLHGRPSNVPSATGARSRAVLGKLVAPASGWLCR